MHFSAKCNSGRIAIQWFHIKHYLDYQYTKFQPYTFRVQKMCVFARYATLVPRLIWIDMRFLDVRIAPLPCILNGVGTAVSVLKLLESTNPVITFRITLPNDGQQYGTKLSAVKNNVNVLHTFQKGKQLRI